MAPHESRTYDGGVVPVSRQTNQWDVLLYDLPGAWFRAKALWMAIQDGQYRWKPNHLDVDGVSHCTLDP